MRTAPPPNARAASPKGPRRRALALALLACTAGCAARPASPAPPPPAPAPAAPSPETSRGRPERAALGYALSRGAGLGARRGGEGYGPGGAAARPADRAAPPPAPADVEAEPAPPRDWRKTAGVVSVAVGTTLVAMGVSASLRLSSVIGDFRDDESFLRYRDGIQRGDDVCDAVDRGAVSPHPDSADLRLLRERCQTLSVWKVIQPLGYIGGGAVIAGGAALLVSAALSPPPSPTAAQGRRVRLSFAPSLGPSSAGATLAGTW